MRFNPNRQATPITPAARYAVVLHTSAALAIALLAIFGRATAQDVPADLADGAAVTVRAPIEPPQELTPEQAVQSLAARKERLREFYDEWQRKAVEAGSPPEEAVILDAPPEARLPPPPDAPNGEITLERQQGEAR